MNSPQLPVLLLGGVQPMFPEASLFWTFIGGMAVGAQFGMLITFFIFKTSETIATVRKIVAKLKERR